MSKNPNGLTNHRGFRYADSNIEKQQKSIKENNVFLMDPIPVEFSKILREDSKDHSKIRASPFMKTKAFLDIEKLYD
jgi:hypothetical protein